jgi:hypothetical protein
MPQAIATSRLRTACCPRKGSFIGIAKKGMDKSGGVFDVKHELETGFTSEDV